MRQAGMPNRCEDPRLAGVSWTFVELALRRHGSPNRGAPVGHIVTSHMHCNTTTPPVPSGGLSCT